MALPASTANWHWKNKNVTRWGKEWFERELVNVNVATDEGESVSVLRVTDVEGDIELGQRKSKLITIYDCKIELEWTGTASDGTEVKGKLVIPEVSHEITVDGLSDYAYSWSVTTDRSKEVDALFAIAKSRLTTALEVKFAEFPQAMISTHGKDITISADPSRSGTPALAASAASVASPASSSAQPSAPAAPKPVDAKAINTSTVTAEGTFMAAADDLFDLFTNEQRIPMWTRAPAKSTPQPGAEYSLFGGGVQGKYISLTKPKEIVAEWVLKSPTWPSGHVAKLTTSLDQSSDSTKVTFSLEGVPKGMEDEIRRNLEGYYIHGLKSIGLGTVL